MTCCQQDELYRAEETVRFRGRSFTTAAELQRWVDDLRERPWWERFYARVLRVEATFIPSGKGSVGAWFPDRRSGRIEMLPEHRNELYVCHELTHVLAAARYGSQAHCPWFARVYLEVVYEVMGPAAFDDLHEAFHDGGVQHDPPREDLEFGTARFVL